MSQSPNEAHRVDIGTNVRLAVIGECMVELSNCESSAYLLGYGGDTLNTAIYFARCDGEVEYITALSDDIFSSKMLESWRSEGVGIEHVKIIPNTVPGLYLIENDDQGERHFHYWRANSPARALLDEFPEILSELDKYDAIFLSGITLSLYSASARRRLFEYLRHFRASGGLVVFDNNYRAKNWSSISEAVEAFGEIMGITDIALLSMEDEIALYGPHSITSCTTRWLEKSATEVIVKNGAEGIHLADPTDTVFFDVPNVVSPVDTTAAGDSFNGAFLAARAKGYSLERCIRAGQFCAAQVIMHTGAIVDKDIPLIEGEL
ncbi:sugar kinase [Paraglaciecola chathamensis]|nr:MULTISPECIES: sugar kinase [Paraglaciecola]